MKVFMSQALEPEGVAILERVAEVVSPPHLNPLTREEFLNCALNESTHHLINERTFRLMKPTAILINTSRGPTVDLNARYQALKEGRLGGAGLDVFEPEPVPADHPILSLDNLVFTPHLGTSTMGIRIQMAESAARGAVSVLMGEEPEFLLNPEVRQVRPP